MNVILLLVDSLNRHHLEPYGCDFVKTPNLQAFADKGVVMTRHFAGSLPCMPARREIFAGVREFPWRGWGHLDSFDKPLPQHARERGYITKLVTDHYHYFTNGSFGYYQSFDAFDFIRGQELDGWKTENVSNPPAWVQNVNKFRHGLGNVYYRNTVGFTREEDWFTPKVFTAAQDWLRGNAEHPFFMFIDHFEVHEPFYCVEPYRSLYTDDPGQDYNIWPPYQDEAACARFFAQTTPEEVAFIRAQYWGKVTWVDTYIGRLMETLDKLHLWDNTAVIITTDHGHDLAVWRQMFGKQPPHHDSHANLPLLIWHPQIEGGRRIDALTSTVDLHATVRAMLGEEDPQAPNGRSFLPVLQGETSAHRSATLCGTYATGALVADPEHSYVHQPAGNGEELYWYSSYMPRDRGPSWWNSATSGQYIPNVPYPVWRMRVPGEPLPKAADHRLYRHADGDPSEQPNLIDQEPALAEKMRALMRKTLQEDGCPPEQFARLGLE